METTYKYERGVEILLVFLHKLLIVLLCLLAVTFVKFGTKSFPRWLHVLSLSMRGIRTLMGQEVKQNLQDYHLSL